MLAGEKCEGTSKVMVCLVVAQWLFVETQCLRGEGRQGELMVRDCGEVRQGKGGESGPLWQGTISHVLTLAHTFAHIHTNAAAAVIGLSLQPFLPMDVTHSLR